MKTRYGFSLIKVLLLGGSLLLAACDNAVNIEDNAEEELLIVQSEFDDNSGIINGLDDSSTGPSATDGLSEAQITVAQEALDAIDAP